MGRERILRSSRLAHDAKILRRKEDWEGPLNDLVDVKGVSFVKPKAGDWGKVKRSYA